MKVEVIVAEKEKRGIKLYSISEDATLKDAAAVLSKNNVGALLVSEKDQENRYIGILSERDIIHHCCKDRPMNEIKVTDAAVKNMIVVSSEDTLETARGIMARHHIRHLPVIKDQQVYGMITIRDVISVMDEQKDLKIQHLSDFVGGTYNSSVY
jgi:CBS domain-containing protein